MKEEVKNGAVGEKEKSIDTESNGNGEPIFDETTERGVHNPRIIDLITREEDTVVLTIIEFRPWNSDAHQFEQLQEKFNNYLDYIFDGHFAAQYPRYNDLSVTIEVQSTTEPTAEVSSLFSAMENYLRSAGLHFRARIIDKPAS